MAYVGRFAPSPTGFLHFGSLLAAVASFVDARAHGGHWLVRMEDIDPPREVAGSDAIILRTLERHALVWDGVVLYQSTRYARYREVLEDLKRRRLGYRCACTRARQATLGGIYDGYCLQHLPSPDIDCALRLSVFPPPSEPISPHIRFCDRIHGLIDSPLQTSSGDFIIHRKDGLFAYPLAVVVDDIEQGITDVVRGADMLEATARQIYLTQLLHAPVPRHAHIPVAMGADGRKLSKQNRAPALDNATPAHNLWRALHALGQAPPTGLAQYQPAEILAWAVGNWHISAVPKQQGKDPCNFHPSG